MSERWGQVHIAADGSRVLLTLLLTGDEQKAQEQLDRMSVDELGNLSSWSVILGNLAHYTRGRKIHESREGQTP